MPARKSLETRREIAGVVVFGVDVDPQTRCAHYRSERDIVAIKFKYCGNWYCCHECHAEFVDHAAKSWPKEKFNERAILCGNCGHQLTIREYLECESVCPHCRGQFNPNCAKHYQFYFEI